MRRKLLGLACAVTATVIASVLASSQPAGAASYFPGAGYGVKNVSGMTAKFHVPQLSCHSGENSVVVFGLFGPAVATLDGWNAAAVVGCFRNAQWSRIQVWVNAPGYGHKVAAAAPGDFVRTRLLDANTAHPTVETTNLTTGSRVTYKLAKRATVAAAGSYAGLMVPKFPHVNMSMWANHKPLHALDRAKRTEWRHSVKLMEPTRPGGDRGDSFAVYFRHH